MSSTTVHADGQTATVTVSILNNPGIASLVFSIAYDDVLTLQNVVFDSAYGAYVVAPTPYKNPQTVTFISPLAEVDASGTFATLTFNISEAVTVDTNANITLTIRQGDTFDENFKEVTFDVINGTVSIEVN